jgi:hypothetical protein
MWRLAHLMLMTGNPAQSSGTDRWPAKLMGAVQSPDKMLLLFDDQSRDRYLSRQQI